MSTTPETARTAARDTPEWKAIYDDINKGVQYTDMSIAPALLADVICNAIERLERRLTPPPASRWGHLEDVTNPVADPEFVASMPAPAGKPAKCGCGGTGITESVYGHSAERCECSPSSTPAGETVSVARDVAEKYVREPVTYRGDMRDACIAALSTPPGHTRVVSNANYSLATPDADVAAGSTQPGPLVERPPPDACWRELRVVAEDAADCILRGVPQHAEANRLRDLAIACSFVTPPTQPAVKAKWRIENSCIIGPNGVAASLYGPNNHHAADLVRDANRFASRVSNAKQADAGVTLPADDRAWEKECQVDRCGNSWCICSKDGEWYYWDGRWMTDDEWGALADPNGWYLSVTAARAALAKAKKPPTT